MDIPKPLAWERRANSASPMPGGYTGYLDSLRTICEHVERGRTSFEELVEWSCQEFAISETSARVRLNFLRSAGLLSPGIVALDELVTRWLKRGPAHLPIAIIHSRIRFIGEMLSELRQPQSAESLRKSAARYGLDWQTLAQIDSRRGWLQSAKLIEGSNDCLNLTRAGEKLLDQLDVHDPGEATEPSIEPATPTRVSQQSSGSKSSRSTEIDHADKLADALLGASTDSGNPVRFERLVRDAFKFLGFVSEHLGGSGSTDVLLTASLGRDDSYRVAVDAKTTASGSLKDSQVDWHTLIEHRDQHDAKYSLLVAPNPAGGRLVNRAQQSSVAVLSAEQLADLCRRHARTPLSLFDYERLFSTKGEVDLTVVDDAAGQMSSLLELVSRLCRGLSEKTDRFGRMSARDVQLAFGEGGQEFSQEEIQQLLRVLAHPLIGVVYGFRDDATVEADEKYVVASSRSVSTQRIRILAGRVAEAEQ